MTETLLDWLTIDRIGILFGIILGVVALLFKWKGWRIAEEANKIAKEANEISKNIQKKQHEYDKEIAKQQIIRHLKRFIRTEESDMFKIEDMHQEKITKVGNDFNEILMSIDKDKIGVPQNILGELLEFTDKIRDLSKQRLVLSQVHGRNLDMEKEQKRIREEKGNKLIEDAKEFIEKLEK